MPKRRPIPHTPPWFVRVCHETSADHAIAALRNWAHTKRREEITPDFLKTIRQLPDEQAEQVVCQLQEQPLVVQGKRNTTRLEIPITLTTLDDHRNFDVNALLAPGAAMLMQDIL